MKQQMGLSKKFSCFYLLILLLLLLLFHEYCSTSAPTSTHDQPGSARHGSFKPVSSASSQRFRPVQSHGDFEAGNQDHKVKDGDDEVFGDEKRKVYTGPNPLHNR
ncbi:hypothetical protein DITRI_Ditri05aG0085800 [Diplodiscus trichospermus]